jgi:hypothetical protein
MGLKKLKILFMKNYFIKTKVIKNQRGRKSPLFFLKVKLYGAEFYVTPEFKITEFEDKAFKTNKLNLINEKINHIATSYNRSRS